MEPSDDLSLTKTRTGDCVYRDHRNGSSMTIPCSIDTHRPLFLIPLLFLLIPISVRENYMGIFFGIFVASIRGTDIM